MKKLSEIVRPNILALKPYSCARDEFQGVAQVYVDANENPNNDPYNRYPDPRQTELKQAIATVKNVRPSQIMLGNGSDEPIDLIYRIFCEPSRDNVVAIEPTYGMYRVCADINNVEYRSVNLDENFDVNADELLRATDKNTKVIWLCSPNNPTGNSLNTNAVEKILTTFEGIVVIDEAYIDFSNHPSWLERLNEYKNLIVLQTFSKAWAMASVRCGMAFASEEIQEFFAKVKYPYNINLLTQQFVSEQIKNIERKENWVKEILSERERLREELAKLSFVQKIYPTDANFVLVKVEDANFVYNSLKDKGIIVRNRTTVTNCENCLRITVGTKQENEKLLTELLKL